MKKIWKRIASGLMALAVVMTMSATTLTQEVQAVTQDDIDALKTESENLEAQMSALESQIAALASDKSQALAAKSLLDTQISLLETETSNLTTQIEGYDDLIAAAEAELLKTQEEEAVQYELFCARVRSMEENGTTSYWSVLFGAESFSDMLAQLDIINEIMDADQAVIDNLKAIQADIEQQAAVLELSRSDAQDTKDDLESTVAELDVQRQAQIDLIAQIMADQSTYESAMSTMEAEEASVQAEIMAKSAELAAQSAGSSSAALGGYIWPVTSRRITSPFGERNTGIAGASTYHNGVDIGGVYYNSSVYAAKAGTVITSQYSSSYGNYVVVSHGSGNTTLYAHMSSRSVSVGDYVNQGDVLGITGSTGISSGPHLHFEISENGERLNPLIYLTGYIEAW
ncbi:peptidoglycan DD-metalloendopeptidase family protein [Bengtsoniella intestinalis]|uniref:murein hydrolase activator EnvC family protein n=1 Tax=Bengtsoniella intestinalis TaxID=3073143 RepID=UPI00391F231A